MVIHSKFLESGDLEFLAYSSDDELFEAMGNTFRKSAIPHFATAIGADEYGRVGRKYIIPEDFVRPLEKLLRGKFETDGKFVPNQA